jgi:hypothetical protein
MTAMKQEPTMYVTIRSIPSPPPPGVTYEYRRHTGTSYFVRARLRKEPRA